MQVIALEPSSRYERETYGITYVGRYHHKIHGAKHNRRADFTIRVWDNTVRPNPCPEGKYTEFGWYGGPGAYLGPDNLGTDNPYSITTSAEAVVIALRPLATKQDGPELQVEQVYSFVVLGEPEVKLGQWLLTQASLADPHFELVP